LVAIVVVWENVEVAFDNEPSDQDGDAGDTENCGLASVSVMLRFCRCPVASKTSSTETRMKAIPAQNSVVAIA
jgi:hypothetical protein